MRGGVASAARGLVSFVGHPLSLTALDRRIARLFGSSRAGSEELERSGPIAFAAETSRELGRHIASVYGRGGERRLMWST